MREAVFPSRLGLGCSRLGSFNNKVPPAQQQATVIAAFEAGIRLFDTADVYGQGDSERTIGRLLRRYRDDLFIVTKVGKRFSRKMRMLRPLKPVLKPLLAQRGAGAAVAARRDDHLGDDFSPARFANALDASLRRLAMARVDALLLHSPSAGALETPGLAPALDALVQSGRALHWGVSCDDAPALERALALPGLSLLQLPFDLIEQTADEPMLATAREQGVRVIAREVIRLQPSLAPVEAVCRASSLAGIDCVLVGASAPERIREIASAIGEAVSC